VRAPEGNGCAERFIRTLKENLLWVRTFDTIEQLRHALIEFREVYNTTWCTACGFWDTGLKPTLPEHAVEAVAGDIRPG
jgi:hypothetical protein